MKVKLITGIYPPEIGGPALFIPNLAKFLLKSGHDCDVLTLANEAPLNVQENWHTTYIKRNSLPVRMAKVINNLFSNKNGYNLYFANGLIEEVGFFLFITRKMGIAKVVGDAVWERARNNGETTESVTDFNLHTGTLVQRIQRKLLVFALNQFELIICPSNELKRLVSSWGVLSTVVVIQNGVKISEQIHSNEREIDVVTVSRLVNWKNIDYVIKACQHTNASLWIIGDGPEKEHLVNIAKDSIKKVVFAGALPNSEIIKVLERSKLFVLFSDYEGLSFALLEAMSSGAVPIVSNCEGNSAVIVNDETGCIVPQKNLELLTHSIEKLLSNRNLRKRMAENSHRLISEKFSIDKRLNDYLELFESVAK